MKLNSHYFRDLADVQQSNLSLNKLQHDIDAFRESNKLKQSKHTEKSSEHNLPNSDLILFESGEGEKYMQSLSVKTIAVEPERKVSKASLKQAKKPQL